MSHQVPNTYLPKSPRPRQNHLLIGTRGGTGEGSVRAFPVTFRGGKGSQCPSKPERPSPSSLCPPYIRLTIKGPCLPLLPSCPQETAPKPFHNTRQMARRTDGPFTQASRNRQGPARMRAWGQMELRQGGPRSPEERSQTPETRNRTNKRLVSMTQEGATVRMGMT